MIELGLNEIAKILVGTKRGPGVRVVGVGIDSRSLQGGDLFVALRGPNFDGHQFVEAAREAGAAAGLVEQYSDSSLPQVRVEDTRRALGALAQDWRGRFDMPLIAITGSNGKTTVKEMIASILRRRGEVLATRGNLNNDLGVPLTLFGLADNQTAAVVEMGANHPREIAHLTELATPTVGVVTNAAAAHLEGFGTVRGVAQAKGELFAGLRRDATAIINRDDAHHSLWQKLAGERNALTFGVSDAADFQCRHIKQHLAGSEPWIEFELYTPTGSARIELPLAGEHNVLNAAAAAAAASVAGADLDDCVAGLRACGSAPGRLQLGAAIGGARLLDDTYNANPNSTRAALRFLAAQQGSGVFVFGDMGELGPDARRLHTEMGVYAREQGVARLLAVGTLSQHAVDAFGSGAEHFSTQTALIEALKSQLDTNTVVLVKGSRAMQMENIVAALRPTAAEG